jgi:hypothetical protein
VLLADWLAAVEIDAFGLHRGYVAVKGEQILAAALLHDYPLLRSRGGTASVAVCIGLGQGQKDLGASRLRLPGPA